MVLGSELKSHTQVVRPQFYTQSVPQLPVVRLTSTSSFNESNIIVLYCMRLQGVCVCVCVCVRPPYSPDWVCVTVSPSPPPPHPFFHLHPPPPTIMFHYTVICVSLPLILLAEFVSLFSCPIPFPPSSIPTPYQFFTSTPLPMSPYTVMCESTFDSPCRTTLSARTLSHGLSNSLPQMLLHHLWAALLCRASLRPAPTAHL